MKKIIMFVALFAVTVGANAQSLNGKIFKIQSAAPGSKGKVIDADGYTLGKNGTKIQLWENNNATHQQWQFQFAGRGANNYYIISMSPRAGKINFLDASGGHLANNGGIVQLWKNNLGGKNQLWKVTKNSNGTYRIANTAVAAKGASLDADGYTQGKNGGKIQLWEALNNKNQEWNLISLVKTYKVGEKLPNGAIVTSVKNDGTHGQAIWLDNTQKFNYMEAQAKVAKLGKGWSLPNQNELKEFQRNLHKKSTVKFTNFYYWASGRKNKDYADYVRFGDGYSHYGPVTNKFNICLIYNF